jgi:hypothetical protein
MKFLKQIIDFLLCLLQADCKYSIKKFLCYIFAGLVIYLAIWTDKSYYDLLGFIAILLGIRSYERIKGGHGKSDHDDNHQDPDPDQTDSSKAPDKKVL